MNNSQSAIDRRLEPIFTQRLFISMVGVCVCVRKMNTNPYLAFDQAEEKISGHHHRSIACNACNSRRCVIIERLLDMGDWAKRALMFNAKIIAPIMASSSSPSS